MRSAKMEARAQARLEHVRSHIESPSALEGIQRRLGLLERKEGSFKGCLGNFSSDSGARAIYSWFGQHDLRAAKNWAYVSGKCNSIARQGDPEYKMNAYPPFIFDLLLADHPALINWAVAQDYVYTNPRGQKPKTFDFHRLQTLLALKGDWTLLRERSQRVVDA